MKTLLLTILILGSLSTWAQDSLTVSVLGYNVRMYEDGKAMKYDLQFNSYNDLDEWNSNAQTIECTYKKEITYTTEHTRQIHVFEFGSKEECIEIAKCMSVISEDYNKRIFLKLTTATPTNPDKNRVEKVSIPQKCIDANPLW